jgi:hypothetical protein
LPAHPVGEDAHRQCRDRADKGRHGQKQVDLRVADIEGVFQPVGYG